MKLHHSLLASALLAVVSTSAAAQSTGVVTIGGTIVPAACTLTSSGTVNFGTVNLSTLPTTGFWTSPIVSASLTFNCPSPTLFVVSVIDNKPTTVATRWTTPTYYGLGLTSAGARIGGAQFRITANTGDGTSIGVVQSTDRVTWSNASTGVWWEKRNWASATSHNRAYGVPATGPTAITTGNWQMVGQLYIENRNALQLTQNEAIEASATFELIYI